MAESPDPERFAISQLSYLPKDRAVRTLGRYALIALFWGGAALVAILLVIESLKEEPRTANPWALFAGAVVVVVMLVFGYGAAQLRTFSVSGGVMTLPLPTRLRGGGRFKTVLLRDIEEAIQWKGSGGEPGVLVRLRNGTEFALFEQELPPDAGEFLRRLVSVFTGEQTRNGPEHPEEAI